MWYFVKKGSGRSKCIRKKWQWMNKMLNNILDMKIFASFFLRFHHPIHKHKRTENKHMKQNKTNNRVHSLLNWIQEKAHLHRRSSAHHSHSSEASECSRYSIGASAGQYSFSSNWGDGRRETHHGMAVLLLSLSESKWIVHSRRKVPEGDRCDLGWNKICQREILIDGPQTAPGLFVHFFVLCASLSSRQNI